MDIDSMEFRDIYSDCSCTSKQIDVIVIHLCRQLTPILTAAFGYWCKQLSHTSIAYSQNSTQIAKYSSVPN